jgi:hypothetical protein
MEDITTETSQLPSSFKVVTTKTTSSQIQKSMLGSKMSSTIAQIEAGPVLQSENSLTLTHIAND